MQDLLSGIAGGVLAHQSFAIFLFVLHFEPNTLRQDRLCPQRFCFAHDGTEQSWNFEHRCQEVLVYAAGMVGHLYGLDLETSVKFIRSSTVFANIVPVDGDATWTSEAGSKPPEDYQKITKITDPIMESVFGRLPVLCPNLKGVFVFGEYANDARQTLLQGMDPPIISGPRHCHPQRHVCPFATEDEKRLLINSMSEWWVGILNISKPIKLEPRDLKIEMIFRKSRRTGTDAPGGTDAVYDAMYCFEYETRGSQEERLAEVDERHPGTRAELEKILTGVTIRSFERNRMPYLQNCETRGCNYDFIRCTHEHKKDPEYKKTYSYIQALRKRLQAGKLRCGEGKVIKKLEDVFNISIKDEDVQQMKKVVLGRDEETIRNTLSGSWPS